MYTEPQRSQKNRGKEKETGRCTAQFYLWKLDFNSIHTDVPTS